MSKLTCLASRDEYTIGWIAALPSERAAAIVMLDEKHGKPVDFEQPLTDSNSYTWGRIDENNIVIASLPKGLYGTTSAATTALPLLSSFPQVRFGLMVGIGAGIPRPNKGPDIRLGDIVVSQPDGNSGGVLQYDLGKAKSGGKWERKDFLNKPPEVLLRALGSLEAERIIQVSRVAEFLADAVAHNPRLVKAGFTHPGVENDCLFEASYDHIMGRDCCNCDPAKIIPRMQRESTEPEIHYGLVASGNTLVKDAAFRDSISDALGEECICLEMEAAGLMNNFPCLVIRGICGVIEFVDYADAHKNDKWQQYAAATAAAFAKELLHYVPSADVKKIPKASEIVKEFSKDVNAIRNIVSETHLLVEQESLSEHATRVMQWLSSPDPSTNFNRAREKCHPGTGSWVFEHPAFLDWQEGNRKFLWLHGIPGCGKTILSSIIINHLRSNQIDATFPTLMFFFDFTDASKQSVASLVRSLTAQLYRLFQPCQDELNSLYSICGNGSSTASTDSLTETFLSMLHSASKVSIVIDALDECQTRQDLVRWIRDVCTSAPQKLYIIATSRRELQLESGIQSWASEDCFIPLEKASVDPDINHFVRARLHARDHGFQRWHSRPSVLQEIEASLTHKAAGMFRWAACQLDVLQQCLDLRQLRKALESLPDTLDETYTRILASIPNLHKPHAIRILQLLTYSDRPLRLDEIVDAIVVDPGGDCPFHPDWRMPNPKEITMTCSSLVITAVKDLYTGRETLELQLAHFSVKEYLISDLVETSFKQSLMEINARKAIAQVCITYIDYAAQRTEWREKRFLDNQFEFKTWVQFKHGSEWRRIQAHYPFLRYAAEHWMQHADRAVSLEHVWKEVNDFLFSKHGAAFAFSRLVPRTSPPRRASRRGLEPPLYTASLNGCGNIVEMLLKHGTDVEAIGGYFGNALQAAAHHGHEAIVQMLLKHGADVNAKGGFHYGNALQAASGNGHEVIVQMFLKKGAEVNAREGYYGHALQAASAHGHEVIVRILLKHGADVNAHGGSYYGNALQAASGNGHEVIVQMFLKKGAEVNAREGYYGHALQAASAHGHEVIVRILLKHGADVNAQGGYYGHALQAASANGHEAIVRILLENDVDVNAGKEKHHNALATALRKGYQNIVQMLLEHGADYVDSAWK